MQCYSCSVEQDCVFKTISAILSLGNAEFKDVLDEAGHEVVTIAETYIVDRVAELLGIFSFFACRMVDTDMMCYQESTRLLLSSHFSPSILAWNMRPTTEDTATYAVHEMRCKPHIPAMLWQSQYIRYVMRDQNEIKLFFATQRVSL